MTTTSHPYTAPVYLTYRECFQGLLAQGFRGFFKGNGCRLMRAMTNGSVRFWLIQTLLYRENFRQYEVSPTIRRLTIFGLLCAADILSYPFMTAESRFTLAHLQRKFRSFSLKSMFDVSSLKGLMNSGLFRGIHGIFVLNFFQMMALDFSLMDPSSFHLLRVSAWTHVFGYPLVTAMRRLQAQSADIGLIPIRYANLRHALKLIYNEEGFRGLYRGFVANSVGLALAVYLNPGVSPKTDPDGPSL